VGRALNFIDSSLSLPLMAAAARPAAGIFQKLLKVAAASPLPYDAAANFLRAVLVLERNPEP